MITSQEFQQKIEDLNKQWQAETEKTIKITEFVSTSPAISEREKQELQAKTEKQKFSSENMKKQHENNKKIAETIQKVYKREKENIESAKKQLEKFKKNENTCGNWEDKQGKFRRFAIDYIALQKCDYGTIYRLENNVYIYHTSYNIYESTWTTELSKERFYIYAQDLQVWVEIVPENRKFQRGEMPEIRTSPGRCSPEILPRD